jgi:rhodanese-related sulfurtransferase
MFRTVCMVVVLATLVAGTALAASYNYVQPETMKTWIETKKPVIVVDIQVPAEFAKRHLPGSVETNAFPAKSDDEKKRLEKVLATINGSNDDVVIVCPRGGGGAKNTYEYLKSRGVDEKRMYILEKGMEGWPYPEMCATGR